MHKSETYLQKVDRHICEAGWRIARQEMLIAKLVQGGQRRDSDMRAIS